ncbi:MAG: hypothetical protein EBZ69_10020 [Alphaproteobacteria bacterium]|nr:hypothetical protein [Alphaproteobacteria bacterium]
MGLRSIISPFNLGCSFFALGLLPLHIFYTLVYLIPIYTALMAAVILKEKTDTRTWLAISAGLMGALIAIYGSADNTTYQVDMIGVIVALIGGILFACNQLITRKASASEHRLALAFYPLTFNIIFSSILCVIFFDDLKIGDPASGNMALLRRA